MTKDELANSIFDATTKFLDAYNKKDSIFINPNSSVLARQTASTNFIVLKQRLETLLEQYKSLR